MHPVSLIAITLVLFAAGPVFAQTLRQQQQREAFERQIDMRLQEANQKLSGFEANQRVNQKLNSFEVNQRVNNFNAKTSATDDHTKAELARLRGELTAAQQFADRKISAMKSAGEQDWERMKSEAYAAIENLNRIYGRMQSLQQ